MESFDFLGKIYSLSYKFRKAIIFIVLYISNNKACLECALNVYSTNMLIDNASFAISLSFYQNSTFNFEGGEIKMKYFVQNYIIAKFILKYFSFMK